MVITEGSDHLVNYSVRAPVWESGETAAAVACTTIGDGALFAWPTRLALRVLLVSSTDAYYSLTFFRKQAGFGDGARSRVSFCG